MKEPLWKFIDDKGDFVSENASRINTLYFPLCNASPFMSSVSADLHGDIKTNFNSFLLEPVSRISLSNSKSSRNFWIYINPKIVWSVTGVSKDIHTIKNDKFRLEAGLLWQKITRQNKKIGLKAQITSFVPATGEPVEIMYVEMTNISSHPIKFIPTAAIPIFARSAHNLHDHRHVTSLLNRIQKDKFGVIVKPTLSFDEAGHKKNLASYFVLGIDEEQHSPEHIYPTQEEFTGLASDLEAPEAIFNNLAPNKNNHIQGKEAMGALRFKTKILQARESCSYIILMGITENKAKINPSTTLRVDGERPSTPLGTSPEIIEGQSRTIKSILHRFNTPSKVESSLKATKNYWQKKSAEISTNTQDKHSDNWFRWVNIQPTLRRIFGCSFLPDFDYGRGGRGWRDLWQDCLYLTLIKPRQVRPLIMNNFSGIRIDGSNATIIGRRPVEFTADRNNIARVWMDHGIWPLITAHLYIHQSADLKIVLEETPYFKDQQLSRSQEKDENWKPEYGTKLKTKTKKVYKGTILEHLLVENLVQFFNVGCHNHVRLENADWNDGLDMAAEEGESVAFSAMYGQNLSLLSEIIERLKLEKIVILKELQILLDSLHKNPIDYSNVNAKHKLLERYFQAVKYEVSGEKISLPASGLIKDLKKKADWISRHIQKTAWLKEGFFNGYYDNARKKVEGKQNGIIRMTLTAQTFPLMSGIATEKQIKTLFKNVKKYLQDKELGGFRLNTDFKEEQPNLGRAFSFIYGDKENGAFFNHMSVMFAYALYKRGFAKQGYEVINSIFRMAKDTERNKTYPCLPEYFNSEGRGMYSYLTGSASWFILTLLTQSFGIRGEYGNLVIEPKLTAEQFGTKNAISITCSFAQKKIEVRFISPRKKDFGKYSICKASLNRKTIAQDIKKSRLIIARDDFLALANNNYNIIEVVLD